MSVEAFLDWEERQELRYEFDGFEPVAMGSRQCAEDRRCGQHPLPGRIRDVCPGSAWYDRRCRSGRGI
jgi:hypothetical protein